MSHPEEITLGLDKRHHSDNFVRMMSFIKTDGMVVLQFTWLPFVYQKSEVFKILDFCGGMGYCLSKYQELYWKSPEMRPFNGIIAPGKVCSKNL